MTEKDKFDLLVSRDPCPGIRNRLQKTEDGASFIIPGWVTNSVNNTLVSTKGMKKFYKDHNLTSQILYDVLVLGLTSIEERPKCPVCGKEIKYRGNLTGKYSGYNETCSNKCRLNLIRDLSNTDEAKRKQVESMRRSGGYNHLYWNTYRKDHPVLDSTREKISKANKGKKQPPEAAKKSAESRSKRFKEHPEELEKFVGNYKRSKKGRVSLSKAPKGYYTYLSSWEEMFAIFCNELDFIATIENPEGIEYQFNNSIHYYYPDMLLTTTTGLKLLIEIKPKYYLTDEKNQAKFSAGKSWVQSRDNYLGYVIYTEDDLLDGNRYSTELSKEKLLSKIKLDLNLTQN